MRVLTGYLGVSLSGVIALLASATAAPPSTEAATSQSDTAAEDSMADQLNAAQTLKQKVNLTRKIDGKVVASEERTIIYDRQTPVQQSEAAPSALQMMVLAFDEEVLTRQETLDEAGMAFLLADTDFDQKVTLGEYAALLNSWHEADTTRPVRPKPLPAAVTQKFALIAQESPTITSQQFTASFIDSFQRADVNDDELLSGNEISAFRTLISGTCATVDNPSCSNNTVIKE